MILKNFPGLMLWLLAAVYSLTAVAADTSPATLLSQQFAQMQSMRGHFAQKILDEKGEVLQTASGQFVVKRPRQFYWKTEEPYQNLIVANGDTLWIYDIDLEQVTRKPFTDDLDRAPALILSGAVESLTTQYAISVEKRAGASGTGQLFTLVPHSDGGVFRKLQLSFDDGKLAAMTLEDNFQQLTEFTFSDVIYNPAIDPGQFQFKPPPGIDVIENER